MSANKDLKDLLDAPSCSNCGDKGYQVINSVDSWDGSDDSESHDCNCKQDPKSLFNIRSRIFKKDVNKKIKALKLKIKKLKDSIGDK